jgi:hypothetical protein
MPRTPDRFPGPTYEEGIYLDDTAAEPAVIGEFRRVGNILLAMDGSGVFNLRQGAGDRDNRYLIFKRDGGLVYDTLGDVLEKVSDL